MKNRSQLEYGNRFGPSVVKAAKASLTANTQIDHAAGGSARYGRWFHGEDGTSEPMATSRKKFRKIDAAMAAAEVAAITKENMAILGEDAFELFVGKLPAEHNLRKSVRAAVLSSIPYLGLSKFGEIVGGRSGDHFAVMQVFITNFDGHLDLSKEASFCTPKDRRFDQMIFGVHFLLDRNGNRVGFDHARGENGIAFQTKDLNQALYQIASASTGTPIEVLEARMAAAKQSRRSA
jgi:hypothetical protein